MYLRKLTYPGRSGPPSLTNHTHTRTPKRHGGANIDSGLLLMSEAGPPRAREKTPSHIARTPLGIWPTVDLAGASVARTSGAS